jgi:uncharacterized membrane protein YkgB
LVLVLVWIGGMKVTTVAAEAIEGLEAKSPLLSWIHGVLSVEVGERRLGPRAWIHLSAGERHWARLEVVTREIEIWLR